MKIFVVYFAKAKTDEFSEMADGYIQKAKPWLAIELKRLKPQEILDERAASIEAALKTERQTLLEFLTAAPGPAVFLDAQSAATKTHKNSEAFSQWLFDLRDQGIKNLNFIVGSSYGHYRDEWFSAQPKLALSPFTFSHGLARVVLCEQLFRAGAIQYRHPYHH